MVTLMREALAVGRAHDIDLGEPDIESILTIIDALDPAGYSSMAQDARFRRRMEVDLFGATVARLGELHGVPTPANTVATTILRAKESM